MKDFFQSHTFKGILYGIGIVVLALLIFQAGMFVGFRRAEFSYRWGDTYYRTFGGRPGGMMMGMHTDRDFPNTHGVIGKIVKISLPIIVISGNDKIEKSVVIGNDTQIVQFRSELKPSDLTVGEYVVVVGAPNDASQIDAELIRVVPGAMMGTTTTGALK